MGEQKQVSVKKSLGQVAYEGMYHGHYRALTATHQAQWEEVGEAVKAAVLGEQEELQETGGMAEQESRTRVGVTYRSVAQAVYTLLTARADQVMTDDMAHAISQAVGEGVVRGLEAWERHHA